MTSHGSKLDELAEIEGDEVLLKRNPIVLFWYGAMQKWAHVAICRLIHAPLHVHVYYGDDRPSVKLLNLNQVITVLE